MNSLFMVGEPVQGARLFARLKLAFRIFWNVVCDRTVLYRCDLPVSREPVVTSEGAIAAFIRER